MGSEMCIRDRDISFNIPDMEEEKIVIDQDYVKEKFAEKIHPEDIDRYIL